MCGQNLNSSVCGVSFPPAVGEQHAEHTHVHSNMKSVLNRLARVMGHLESVRRMIEDDRDCSEILVQMAAVRAAITNTGKVILQDHISECIVAAVQSGDSQRLADLNRAIDQFVK